MGHDLIADYLRHLREKNRAENTITTRRLMLYRLNRELPYGLDQANEDELREAIYRTDWSARSQAAVLAGVRDFFGWACRPSRAELDYNPVAELVRPKFSEGLPRPLDDDELAKLLATSAEPYRLYLVLAAFAGMRSIEIARADREHFTEARILVCGKGAKERMVPTHSKVWEAVGHLPPGPVARRPGSGRRTTADRVSHGAAEYFDSIGYAGVTLHRGRHWFATRALESCSNLRVVQELLGHASPNSTAVYTRVSDKSRSAAVAGLPEI